MLNIKFWFLLALDYVLICGARLFLVYLYPLLFAVNIRYSFTFW